METKICTQCKEELPITNEYFYRQKGKFRSQCKKCIDKQSKIYYERNKEAVKEKQTEWARLNKDKIKYRHEDKKTKICTKCRQELSISRFRKKYKKDERIDTCKECCKELIKDGFKICNVCNKTFPHTEQYFNNNKKSKDGLDCICRDCTQNRVSIWQKQNKDKSYKKVKKYQQNNPEKCNIKDQRRRSRKKQLPATLTIEQWQLIKNHFNNRCVYCGKELPLEQEHFIPLSKGGEYTLNNIIPSCKSCNASKHDANFFEWYYTYKYYSKKREKAILDFLGYKEYAKQQLTFIK